MARKVFISFLGGTNYQYCDYKKGEKSYGDVRFIQEATLNYLNVNDEWCENDVALILLTQGAEDSNWIDNGQKDREGNIIPDKHTQGTLEGLETRLKQYNIKLDPIRELPDGNNEKEIWTIFERVFEKIEPNDELYFDITHGFRYLPMLVLVLCSYSKFLKNVTVKSVTYGNYEVTRQLGHGLIVDLLPLSQLQDWTYAAGTYLDSGNVDKLVQLKTLVKNEELQNIVESLETVIKERQTCRGLQIHNSDNLSILKASLEKYLSAKTDDRPEEEPLHQILKEVDKSLEDFDIKSNFMNGFNAAKWCAKNGLFQQAITMLRENFVTLFCERHNLNIMNKEMRLIVETALNILVNKNQNKKNKWPSDLTDDQIACIESVLQDCWLQSQIDEKGKKHRAEAIQIYQEIRDYRNNFNHAGFNEGAPSPKEIETQINEFVDRIITIFSKLNTIPLCS